jgi:hypothetical protein
MVAISKVKPITDEFDTFEWNHLQIPEMIPDHKVIFRRGINST